MTQRAASHGVPAPAGRQQHGLPRLSEIVLKTSHFERLREWYRTFLGTDPFFERTPPPRPAGAPASYTRASDVRMCFFRLHLDYPYTQVLGIFEVPNLAPAPAPGLHHLQLRHASLDALFDHYERLKAEAIRPHRTANHGPGTSFYYADPDGNVVEISAPNFDSEAEYLAYFASDTYAANPSGIEIDAEAYIARYRSGVPKAELVRIG
ncbi:MAG TPA: VOC family protein [Chloroflexota bacterium]|nr:VOC family protein [Chloroflexota bacterium]HZU04490.1 VOC family protein [Chloroflexota bacterium]